MFFRVQRNEWIHVPASASVFTLFLREVNLKAQVVSRLAPSAVISTRCTLNATDNLGKSHQPVEPGRDACWDRKRRSYVAANCIVWNMHVDALWRSLNMRSRSPGMFIDSTVLKVSDVGGF